MTGITNLQGVTVGRGGALLVVAHECDKGHNDAALGGRQIIESDNPRRSPPLTGAGLSGRGLRRVLRSGGRRYQDAVPPPGPFPPVGGPRLGEKPHSRLFGSCVVPCTIAGANAVALAFFAVSVLPSWLPALQCVRVPTSQGHRLGSER